MSGFRFKNLNADGNYTDEDDLEEEGPLTPLMRDIESNADEATTEKSERLDPHTSLDSHHFPDEPLKTLVAALFLGLGFVITTFSLVLTHERMPETDPLPDFILDNFSYVSWGLEVSEYLMLITLIIGITLILAHTHRTIIFRRVFFLLGLMYSYRAVTFFVTSLPKSNLEYHCDPKYTHHNNQTMPFKELMTRVLRIVAGGGFSLSENQVYCGDFIFSGHTMVLTVGYLVIKEYTPRSYFLLHWCSLCTSVSGVVLLLLGRGHYSVDVIIAYFLTTRLWWGYHTLVNTSLGLASRQNSLRKVWWWRIYRYFERNVPGPVPHRYSFPAPRAWKTYLKSKVQRKQKVEQGLDLV